MSFFQEPDDHVKALLRRCGSTNKVESLSAQAELAVALETPLRQGVISGEILGGIFNRMNIEPGSSTEFPLDLLPPGKEDQYIAYTNPGHGRVPERAVEGDYVQIPTYGITSSIDWLLKYAREARWDVVSRAMQVLEGGFTKKISDDGWHTILSAGVDRNILVYDSDAAAGQFTKRLISLSKVVMRRNAGGNSTSDNQGRLTDMFLSIEGVEDIRNWGVDQADEVTRREIFQAADDGASLTRIFGVNLHGLNEFGESQEYQDYLTSELSGSLETSDTELVVGLDLSKNDSFVMPITMPVTLHVDENLHRQQRAGWYGFSELGVAVLDSRRVLTASF